MTLLRNARVAVGIMSAITLFGLFAAEALVPGTTLKPRTISILLAIISAMLAVDIVGQNLPVSIKIGKGEKEDKEQ